MRRSPIFTTTLALVAIAALVSACAPTDEGAGEASGTAGAATSGAASCAKGQLPLHKPGVLTIATDRPAYEPWFVDDDPSNGQGFESAVAYAVATELGFTTDEVEWTTASFNSVIKPGPKDFDFDINQVSISDERKKSVDFSSGYYDVTQALVTVKGSKIIDAKSIADLKSAKLGAQVGTTSYQTIVDVIQPDQDPAVYDRNDDAKLALANGQIDGLVVDLPTALYLAAVEIVNGFVIGQFASPTGTAEQFGLVLDKGSALTDCVSQAVTTLRDRGDLADLQMKWLSEVGGAPVFE